MDQTQAFIYARQTLSTSLHLQAFVCARQTLYTELHLQARNLTFFGFTSLNSSSEIFWDVNWAIGNLLKLMKRPDIYTICWACLSLFNLCTFCYMSVVVVAFSTQEGKLCCGICLTYSELLWNRICDLRFLIFSLTPVTLSLTELVVAT